MRLNALAIRRTRPALRFALTEGLGLHALLSSALRGHSVLRGFAQPASKPEHHKLQGCNNRQPKQLPIAELVPRGKMFPDLLFVHIRP